jgi:hypothetical protein
VCLVMLLAESVSVIAHVLAGIAKAWLISRFCDVALLRRSVAVAHRLDRLVRADAAQVDLGRRDTRMLERIRHDVEGRPTPL